TFANCQLIDVDAASRHAGVPQDLEPFTTPASDIENLGADVCLAENWQIHLEPVFDLLPASAELIFQGAVKRIEQVAFEFAAARYRWRTSGGLWLRSPRFFQ